MKGPLKIAVYSGRVCSTTFIERLVAGLSKSGHQVYLFGVLNRKPARRSGVVVVGYRLRRLSKLWHLLRFGLLLWLFKRRDKQRLDAYLQQVGKADWYSKVKYYPVLWYSPDIFHVQWAKGVSDWIWVQDFGMKLVLSLRGAHINYSPIADAQLAAMYEEYFPQVAGFHAVSKAIGLEAAQYGAEKSCIQVVYSGLAASFLKSAASNPLKPGKNTFQILSVGRPHWIKGYSYALDACKQLVAAGFDFEYTIIGGADAIEYQYQISDLGLDNHVKLVGQRSFDAVQEQIAEADLLLLPSVKEGVANVVLEAMALRTLVLSTDCGGMAEVVKPHETGFLVPIRSAKALAAAVLALAELSETEQKQLLDQAQELIMQQHLESHMVSGMLGLYASVMEAD
ncbi:glycosyltransferase family 4 protein [Bizionia sp. KMM 8389]